MKNKKAIADQLRQAGLEVKATKKYLMARDPNARLPHQQKTWWVVSQQMLDRAEKIGIRNAFSEHTVLGDIFSVPA